MPSISRVEAKEVIKYLIEYLNQNPWDGINMSGNEVEIATYYYVIELEGFDKNYTGYVVVKR